MKVYHGTTEEGYNNILKNGFKDTAKVWNCSENNTLYVYPLDKIIKINGLEDETPKDQQNRAIQTAFENAFLAAAQKRSTDKYVYVIEMDVDIDLLEDDLSCANMNDTASTIDINDIAVSDINKVYICDYTHLLEATILSGMLDNIYIDLENYSEIELNILKNYDTGDSYEILLDLYSDYEEVTTDELN